MDIFNELTHKYQSMLEYHYDIDVLYEFVCYERPCILYSFDKTVDLFEKELL